MRIYPLLLSCERLRELVSVPETLRDDSWQDEFGREALHAALVYSHPSSFHGPDGLGYLGLRFPDGESLDFGSISGNLEDLNKWFLGVCIGPKEKPDYVLSHGDILSYQLYGTINPPMLFGAKKPQHQGIDHMTLVKEVQAQVGAPNDDLFPPLVRRAVREYLKRARVEPRVIAIDLEDTGTCLMFGFDPDKLGMEKCQQLIQAVSWFMPRCIGLLYSPTVVKTAKFVRF